MGKLWYNGTVKEYARSWAVQRPSYRRSGAMAGKSHYKKERDVFLFGTQDTYIMEKILINGGKPLVGEIETSGMKNAALPIIFGCLLVKDRCVIENLPEIDDVEVSLQILQDMGAKIDRIDRTT